MGSGSANHIKWAVRLETGRKTCTLYFFFSLSLVDLIPDIETLARGWRNWET